MSQPPKTRSFKPASGTKSLIIGVLASVRLPRRMVASCVSDPMGAAVPRFTASTPAMKVVLTAPMPGIKTPSFPSAGAIWTLSRLGKLLILLAWRADLRVRPLDVGGGLGPDHAGSGEDTRRQIT